MSENEKGIKWFVSWIDNGERYTSKGYEKREDAKAKKDALKECGFKAWMFPLLV